MLLYHHNTAVFKSLLYGVQIYQQYRQLLLRLVCNASKKNERRFAFLAFSEKSAEIGIGRNNDSFLGESQIKNGFVLGRPKAHIAHMDCIMSRSQQPMSQLRRQCVID